MSRPTKKWLTPAPLSELLYSLPLFPTAEEISARNAHEAWCAYYAENTRLRRLADTYKLAAQKGEIELQGCEKTPNTSDLLAARALGIDITFIDDNAPFGEVCGYDLALYRDDNTMCLRPIFFAVRRQAAEAVSGLGLGEPLLVSDHINHKRIDGQPPPFDYKTPPRWRGISPADPL